MTERLMSQVQKMNISKRRWPHVVDLIKRQHKRFKHAMKRSRRVQQSCDTFIARDDHR